MERPRGRGRGRGEKSAKAVMPVRNKCKLSRFLSVIVMIIIKENIKLRLSLMFRSGEYCRAIEHVTIVIVISRR